MVALLSQKPVSSIVMPLNGASYFYTRKTILTLASLVATYQYMTKICIILYYYYRSTPSPLQSTFCLIYEKKNVLTFFAIKV